MTLRENHFGQSHDLLEAILPASAVKFRIQVRDRTLDAEFSSGSSARQTNLHFADIKVPEGRVGIQAQNGEALAAGFGLTGNTQSSFATYAFHCNYRLPDKVASEPLWHYLDAVGSSLLARFPRNFRTAEEFEKYSDQARLRIRGAVGLDPWPERTPLNARVVGVVDRGDFKIEKLIFESQPGFLVDALLYVPKKVKFPAPGILSTIGHYADDGFFIWSEQGRCAGLARKEYVVMTYDPISQGERKWLGNGNHDTLRRKTLMSGLDVSGLMFWDSIRAIDYLTSRPEVDPKRIGVTGVSGGGFNALYTAVLDGRVRAVAPAGFATTFEALIKRGGAGCCAYVANLARYAEMEDVFSLVAPRAMLILGGYMDVLSDRILPVFESARNVYKLYGASAAIDYYLDPDAGHTYSKPMRLEMYRRFNLWLKGIDDAPEAREPKDPEDNLISRDSGLLKVFPSGERGKSVIDLEREYLAKNRFHYTAPSDAASVERFQSGLRKHLIDLMGDMAPGASPVVVSDSKGLVRQVMLKTERDLPVPVSIHQAKGGALLVYFADVPSSDAVQNLVDAGFTVAVPQVRGTGLTRVKDMNSIALYCIMLGKHLYSTRIYDLQRVIDYLLEQPEYKSKQLVVWGEGIREGTMALYLAAIDSRVHAVVSSHGLISYQNIVDMDGLPDFDYYIPGILKHADMPEIVAAIAPRSVIISSSVSIDRKAVDRAAAMTQYAWARNVYRVLGHEERLSIAVESGIIDSLRDRAWHGGSFDRK